MNENEDTAARGAEWKRAQAASLAGLADFGARLARMVGEELPRLEAELDSMLAEWDAYTRGEGGTTNWYIAQKAREAKVALKGGAIPAAEAVERLGRLRRAFRRPARATVGTGADFPQRAR